MSLFRADLAIAALAAAPFGAAAQGYPFSQRSIATQQVAHTQITIEYGRPVARGRDLFGALVPWDSVWHPGADSATVLTFSREVLLNGQRLAAGAYSLWLIPRASGTWTFILNRQARVFHRPYPGAATDALRLEIAPERGAHMESMAIYFPKVLRDEATMWIHWGTTILPLDLKAPYMLGMLGIAQATDPWVHSPGVEVGPRAMRLETRHDAAGQPWRAGQRADGGGDGPGGDAGDLADYRTPRAILDSRAKRSS